jgi:hypothetical protein
MSTHKREIKSYWVCTRKNGDGILYPEDDPGTPMCPYCGASIKLVREDDTEFGFEALIRKDYTNKG